MESKKQMPKGKYKIVVFDIDGTLTIKDDEIPKKTLKVIETLKKQGIKCLIATGRSPKAVERILEKTGIDNYIALNGQYIKFDGDIIYKNVVSEQTIEKIISICKGLDNTHYVLTTEAGYYVPEIDLILAKHTSSVLKEHNLLKELSPNQEICQIEIYCPDEYYHHFNFLKTDYNFTRWHTGGFDIVKKGCSKSKGIAGIIEKMGVDRCAVLAFGDGDNDYDMLEFVGTGVAMDNGTDKTKAVADIIAPRVDDDGIYKVCKDLELI